MNKLLELLEFYARITTPTEDKSHKDLEQSVFDDLEFEGLSAAYTGGQ